MNAFQKIAVAVLVAAFVFMNGGCATTGDPNRPYPPQPEVKDGIKIKLASIKLQETPVYVSSRVFHYDTSNLPEAKVKLLTKGERRNLSMQDLPVVLDPPAKEGARSARIVKAFNAYLDGAGFRRVEVPCQECLIVIIDYGEKYIENKVFLVPIGSGTTYLFTRVRLYFLGEEVIVAREDWALWWKDVQAEPSDNLIALAAKQMGDEMSQAWNWRVALWQQRLSAVQ